MSTPESLRQSERPVRLDFSYTSASSSRESANILKWALPDLSKYSGNWHEDTRTPLVVTDVPDAPQNDWYSTVITLPNWGDALSYAFNIVPHRLSSMARHLGIPEGTWGVDVRLTDEVDEVPASTPKVGFVSITLPAKRARKLLVDSPAAYKVDGDRAVIPYPLDGLGGEQWPVSPFGDDSERIEGADEDETAYLNSDFGDMVVMEPKKPSALVSLDLKLAEGSTPIDQIFNDVLAAADQSGGALVGPAESEDLLFEFRADEDALRFALEIGPKSVASSRPNGETSLIAARFTVQRSDDYSRPAAKFVFGTAEIDIVPRFDLSPFKRLLSALHESPDFLSLRFDLRDDLAPLPWDIEQEDLPDIEGGSFEESIRLASHNIDSQTQDQVEQAEELVTIYAGDQVDAEDVARLFLVLSRGIEAVGGTPLDIRDGGIGKFRVRVPA